MLSFIDKLKRKTEKRAETAAERYHRLVIQVADGKEPSEDETLDALEAAGRTLAHLEHDADKVQRRRSLVKKLQREAEITTELAAVNARLVDEDQRFAKIKKEVGATMQQLVDRRTTLEDERQSVKSVRQDLQRTAGPSAQAAVEKVRQSAAEVYRKQQSTTEHLQQQRSNLKSCESELADKQRQGFAAHELERLFREIESRKAQTRDLDEQSTQLAREQQRLSKAEQEAIDASMSPDAVF